MKRKRLQIVGVLIFALFAVTWVNGVHAVLKYGQNETTLNLLTKETSRVTQSLEEAMRCAREKGFEIDIPEVREAKFLLMAPLLTWGFTTLKSNLIVLSPNSLVLYTNKRFDFAVAHELGHIVDYQSGRINHRGRLRREYTTKPSHPFFELADTLDPQAFADAFAELILETTFRGADPVARCSEKLSTDGV